MATYFFDSSALVKRYARETGSTWVVNITQPAVGHRIYIASITAVEVVSALTRLSRGGKLTLSELSIGLTRFRHDKVYQYRDLDITSAIVNRAMQVAETHALRAYDSVQLAVALAVNGQRLGSGLMPIIFVSADNALNMVAKAEGLVIDNPNSHP